MTLSGAPEISESFSYSGNKIQRFVQAGSLSAISSIQIPESAGTDIQDLQGMWDKELLLGRMARPESSLTSRQLQIADFFSGCGGLTLGITQAAEAVGARVNPLVAVDSNKHALEVYARNFRPAQVSPQNLWEAVDFQIAGRGEGARFVARPVCASEFLEGLRGRVDLILGGPPCQGYSNSNNHTRRNDPRNVLYWIMPALAVALGAQAVIVENVPEVVHDKRMIVETARQLLTDAGFAVTDGVLRAVDHGVPQTRKRHFLVATRGASILSLEAVAKSLKLPQRSVEWAIGDLNNLEPVSAFDSPATLSEVNQARIRHLFEYGLYDMPNSHRPLSHRNGHTYPSIYGRLKWDEPAGTITTGFMTPGRGRYIHPSSERTLTPHEAARLQGFPDSYHFKLRDGTVPPKAWLGQMIGEAVPPAMGYIAGLVALASLS